MTIDNIKLELGNISDNRNKFDYLIAMEDELFLLLDKWQISYDDYVVVLEYITAEENKLNWF